MPRHRAQSNRRRGLHYRGRETVISELLACPIRPAYNHPVRSFLTKIVTCLLLLLILAICIAPSVNLPWSLVTADFGFALVFLFAGVICALAIRLSLPRPAAVLEEGHAPPLLDFEGPPLHLFFCVQRC